MRGCAIVRLANSYGLGHAGILSRLFQQDLIQGLVFLAVCDANVGHVDRSPETAQRLAVLDPLALDEFRRPIRPHTLALSLGLPRETVRRKVRKLLVSGWLTETDQGVIAPGQVVESEALREAMAANTALLVDLYAGLARAGVDCPALPASSDGSEPPHRAIARITAGYFLRAIDGLRGLFAGDLITGLIFAAIHDANTAYLDQEPGTARAALDDHLPDSARRPISALALASRLVLPRETVRRHVRKLESLGACQTVRGGLITPQAILRWPPLIEAVERNAASLQRLLIELRAAGFPPAPVGEAEAAPDRLEAQIAEAGMVVRPGA